MNRHFLIPATIAAAFHAGLLFGIRPEKVHANEVTKVITKLIPFPRFEIDPPAPVEDAETGKATSSDKATPTIPEPPPTNQNAAFEIKVPNIPATTVSAPVSTIPLGPIGPISDIAGSGFQKGDVLRSVDLDNSPRTRSQTAPAYPLEAKKDGRSGKVTVEFMVDESGGVLSPRVTESSDPVFNDSAMRAVARWKFEPGKKDGRAVRFRMAVPIIFSLNND